MTLQRTAQLQRRIQLFAMFGVLVTGLLVGLVTGVPLYQQGRAHSEDTVHAQMHAQAQGVAQYLGRLANVAMLLTSRSVIRDYLEAYNRGEITREELAGFSVARLQDALKQSTDVVGLVRLDASGEPAIRIGLQPERKDWPNVPAQHKEPGHLQIIQ